MRRVGGGRITVRESGLLPAAHPPLPDTETHQKKKRKGGKRRLGDATDRRPSQVSCRAKKNLGRDGNENGEGKALEFCSTSIAKLRRKSHPLRSFDGLS